MAGTAEKNILFGSRASAVAGLVVALVVIFASGGSTKDAGSGSDAAVRKAMIGRGLHVRQQGAAAAEAGRPRAATTSTSRRYDESMEHVPAVGRLPLPALGDLGLLHAARQPAPGRAQPRARRRRVLVGAQGPGVDRRRATGVLRREPDGHVRHADRRARRQGRDLRLDGRPERATTGTATTGSAISPSARIRRAGVHGVPGRLPGQRAGGNTPGGRSGGTAGRARAILARAGVAKLARRAWLKTRCPLGGVRVRVPSPALKSPANWRLPEPALPEAASSPKCLRRRLAQSRVAAAYEKPGPIPIGHADSARLRRPLSTGSSSGSVWFSRSPPPELRCRSLAGAGQLIVSTRRRCSRLRLLLGGRTEPSSRRNGHAARAG